MIRRHPIWSILAVIALTAAACSPTVKDEVLPFVPDPIGEAKALLTNYAAGQPVGSESVGFDDLVERVKQVDQEKAAELKGYLGEVSAKGVANRAKAKELLEHW